MGSEGTENSYQDSGRRVKECGGGSYWNEALYRRDRKPQ